MDKKRRIIIFISIIVLIIIGVIIFLLNNHKSGNIIECSYTIDNNDYEISYTDTFTYNDETLININHNITYKFNNKDVNYNDVYSHYRDYYINYTDLDFSGDMSENIIKFNFLFDLKNTAEERYDEFLGMSKRFVTNAYKDDLINSYSNNYPSSTCKIK